MIRNVFLVGITVYALSAPVVTFSQTPPSADGLHTEMPQMLESITVTASPVTADTEGSGAYTAGLTNSATGFSLSLKETPQSVSIVTRQRIDDQQLRSLGEVMMSATGVSANTLDYRSNYYARGQQILSYQFDGVPTTGASSDLFTAGPMDLDTVFYDRVEIVRGLTGLRTGAWNPSASINLVRKRPTRAFQGQASLGIGSWDNRRTTVDLSSPLAQNGRIRGRIVGLYQDTHSFIDVYTTKKQGFYGVLEADLTPDTLLTLGYEYQDVIPKGVLWGGIPGRGNAGNIIVWPRHQTTSADWTRWDNRMTTAFVTLAHTLDNDWSIRGNVSQTRGKEHPRLLSPYLNYNDATRELEGMNAQDARLANRQNNLDLMASGPFTMWGRTHELVLGATYSNLTGHSVGTHQIVFDGPAWGISPLPNLTDFPNYNGHGYPMPDWNAYGHNEHTRIKVKQTAYYAAGRFSLADSLNLIVGGRFTRYRYDNHVNSPGYRWNGESHLLKETTDAWRTGKFAPYAGLVYDLNDNYSAYASHARIFYPQKYRDQTGNVLPPSTGNTTEAGLKGAFLDDSIQATFSVFNSHQDNYAENDGRNPQGGLAFKTVNGVKIRGIDFDVQGELIPGWNVFFGFSRFTATSNSSGDRLNSTIPRTTAKLYTTYRLPGQWQRLTVGGGVNWQSAFFQKYWNGTGYLTDTQTSYVLVSFMARYQLSKQASLQMNVNNLLDKKYYAMTGFFGQNMYGEPRNVQLTLDYTF